MSNRLVSRFLAAASLAALAAPASAQYVTPTAPLTMNQLKTFLDGAFEQSQHANCVPAINFNSGNSDNAVAINYPTGRTKYLVEAATIENGSTTLTTATMGVFTATGGVGSTIATNQAITVTGSTAGSTNGMQLMTLLNSTSIFYTSTAVYFRVGTAQGVAATGDVCIFYRSMP